MKTEMIEGRFGFTGEELPESLHICLIYDTEEERQSVVSRYLAAGLNRGEQIRYVADTDSPEQIRKWLMDRGVKLPGDIENPSFGIIRATDFYAPTGEFDPESSIEKLPARLEQTRKAGYAGSRVTGEMSWVLKGVPGSDHLLDYEMLLGTVVSDFPFSGMCQYDARIFDGATLFKILQVHPFMVARGQILRNPFYVRSDEVIGPHAHTH